MEHNFAGLILAFALSILAVPLTADAQPAARVPRVGFLDPGDPGPSTAFRQGLQDLGYVEGQNVILEWRSWEGRPARAPELIAELVQLKVGVLVVAGSRLVKVAQQETPTIPIVMVVGGDPEGQGFVASLARPGGNITGLTVQRIASPDPHNPVCRRKPPHHPIPAQAPPPDCHPTHPPTDSGPN